MAVVRDAQNVMASSSALPLDDDLIPEEHRRYFWELVPQTQSRDTAFSTFMHVQIVAEICLQLNIPCIHGVCISHHHLVGNLLVSVSDIVDKLGHHKPRTFNNH